MRQLIAFTLLIAFALGARTAHAAPTTFRCDPLTYTAAGVGQFTIDLYVEDAVDLYGLDVIVEYDEVKAVIVDVDSVRDGVQIEPLATFISPTFVYQDFDTPGTFRFAAAQATPAPPRTGEGAFARITFDAQTSGDLDFNFLFQQTSDRNGVETLSAATDCDIQINIPPTAVDLQVAEASQPKAGIILLLVVGLGGVSFRPILNAHRAAKIRLRR